jgi:hypothetical protein
MTVKELNVGDVFRVVGQTQLWRKWPTEAHRLGDTTGLYRSEREVKLSAFRGKEVEVVERVSEICRVENRLILRGGEVVLSAQAPVRVHRCTPGDPTTEFVLSGSSFYASAVERPTAESALLFGIVFGSNHLNRPPGTDVIAYNGRVYGRATKKEVLGKSAYGGYKLVRNIDGAKRMIVAGLLTMPSEFALYDIIMEHFGPDTVSDEQP